MKNSTASAGPSWHILLIFLHISLQQINIASSWININLHCNHQYLFYHYNMIQNKNINNDLFTLKCSTKSRCCSSQSSSSSSFVPPRISKSFFHPNKEDKDNNNNNRHNNNRLLSARDARVLTPLKGMCLAEMFLNIIQPAYAYAATDGNDNNNNKAVNPITMYFQSSASISNIAAGLKKVLPGFTRSNTLLCTSLCSDEVNADFIDVLSNNYGRNFNLAGLGGVPFVGYSGMGAAVSHIPDQGNIIIVVGSHVGYSPVKELLGKVKRRGRQKLSGACGAAIGALAKVKEGVTNKDSDNNNEDKKQQPPKDIMDQIQDIQEDYIIEQLIASPNKPKDFSDETDAIAWVTYEVLKIAQDRLKSILNPITRSPSFSTANLVVLGGILINKGEEGEDAFQPVTFEVSGVDYFDDFQRALKLLKAEATADATLA